jgi:hypothetical protein
MNDKWYRFSCDIFIMDTKKYMFALSRQKREELVLYQTHYLSSTYFGPPKIFDIVNILAHSSSASTTARA